MAENAKSPNTGENTTSHPTQPSEQPVAREWGINSTPATRRKSPVNEPEENAVPSSATEPAPDADRDEEDTDEAKRAKRIAKKEKHQIW